jgi:hypothetical protein
LEIHFEFIVSWRFSQGFHEDFLEEADLEFCRCKKGSGEIMVEGISRVEYRVSREAPLDVQQLSHEDLCDWGCNRLSWITFVRVT